MIFAVAITIFVLFAASRTWLRFREGGLPRGQFYFWILLWAAIGFVLWFPSLLDTIADFFGIGRGVDLLLYVAVVFIFYLVFRMYMKTAEQSREMTKLVRALAIKDAQRKQ